MAPSCSRCLSANVQNLECEKNCKFCRACMSRFVSTDYKANKLEFLCPNTKCNANITLNSLQDILKDDWKNVVYKRRLRQLHESGHTNLELCPCCNYGAVLDIKKQQFLCLNPHCSKDICCNCRSDAHFGMECKEMGNIQIGLCNQCGTKFFDNKCVEEAVKQIPKMIRTSCETYRPVKSRTFFGKIVDFCTYNDICEIIMFCGILSLGSYFFTKYLKEKL